MSNGKKTGKKLKLRKWVVWVLALLAVIILGITAYIVSGAIKSEKEKDKANVNVSDLELDNVGEIVDNNIEKVQATVEIQLADTAVEAGTKFIVTAIVTPVNTEQALVWSSSNKEIFNVDGAGIVTVNGVGTAVLTATVGNVSDAVVIEGISKVTDGSSNNLPIYNVSMNTSTKPNGGSNSSGSNSSGSNSSGSSSSGNSSGGATSGGNTTGDNMSGGVSNGVTGSGGTSSGSSGGTSAGNGSTSGNTSGGSVSGGTSSGGASSGGTSSGGTSSGGTSSGGASSGGSTTPGGSSSSSGNSGSTTGGSKPSNGNSAGTSGGNTSSGGTSSGGNSLPGGSNTSGGSSGGTTNGGTVTIPNKEDGSGYDSTEIGAQLPSVGFNQSVSNLYVYKENGKYYGQIITQPNVTIVYVKERNNTFDATIKSVLAALLPTEHSQVWTNYVTSTTDRTFTVENRMVRIVMPSAVYGGHSQIVIYNQA